MSSKPGRRGRPPQLSREFIVEAALGADDLSSLSMRDLAGRLGVSHAALYHWVGSREGLFDLISEVMVDRFLPTTSPTADNWREWLTELAWGMHDEFLAVRGYASYIAQPHRHNPKSFGLMMSLCTQAFRAAGADQEMAAQSCYIFALGIVQWLAAREAGVDIDGIEPRFDLYLGLLLGGLPTREAASRPRRR